MGASDFAKLPHIGESVRRKEDYRYLTGSGQYTDDVNLPNQRYAVFVRSPHAHAKILSIDASRAEAMPGVARVFTGKDIEGKVAGLPCGWLITSTDGTPMKEPPHHVLAKGKVRYVGDHVALVVAKTRDQAKDAAERDEDGYIWYAGRADDVIISAGYRIGPFEVESACLEQPAVAEAAAVSSPDERRGTVVKAFIVLAEGHSGSDDLARDISSFVRDRHSAYAYPRRIEFVDDLPKTLTGKIRRIELRERETGGGA